ncbi:MAG: hypothetical protein Q9165_007732 [Trypethelium subeluteriae]
MTKAHVGLGSALTNCGGNITSLETWDPSDEAQFWQIIPSQGNSSSHAFRNKAAGAFFALGVAFVPQEADPSRTQPRLQPMNPNDSGQKWEIGDLGDSTHCILNSANGTSYHLDIHPGNPVYLSSQTIAEPSDPRQQWEFQSIMPIDDHQWSQMVPETYTATSTIATPSSSNVAPAATASGSLVTENTSHRSDLPVSAAVGIGIGGAFALVTLISVLFDLRIRGTKRKNKQQGQDAGAQLPIFSQRPPTQAKEVSAETEKAELSSEERVNAELPDREQGEVELPDRTSENRPVSRLHSSSAHENRHEYIAITLM